MQCSPGDNNRRFQSSDYFVWVDSIRERFGVILLRRSKSIIAKSATGIRRLRHISGSRACLESSQRSNTRIAMQHAGRFQQFRRSPS
ncbi:DUF4060 family protein [Paraburkholderia bannensis]|uniref:DUF4060 family protein n=1 Tax=Paraburkholderia bannensis TaxID=765414 RepID=UPI0038CD5962